MLRWVPYPFLRITPIFIAGILIGNYASLSLSIAYYITLLLLYLVLIGATPKRYVFYISLPAGFTALSIIFLGGYFLMQAKQENRQPQHLTNVQHEFDYYTATVLETPQRKSQVFRTVVSVNSLIQTDSLQQGDQTVWASGKVMLYQPEEDSMSLLQFGDQILIKGKPQIIPSPANPHEFDYRQYLSQQNIYHQQYLSATHWILMAHSSERSVLSLANFLREKCKHILLTSIPHLESAGIALALTLGIKDYLADTIRESYAATGAMHVLAVSGLHVGIIYLVLSLLLKPLLYIPKAGRWLSACICITALWLYALLAGWSPSVLRAATMFTFIIIAQTTRWQTNIYNTLAASAFFLLCYDPLLIFSVGFQLSYLAVTGIVYLQPKIYQWLDFHAWIPDKLWSLTAVSLAAQLATLPVSLYYFHQFPVYFWLSNLLVIPAAFVILSFGLLTILSGFLASAVTTIIGMLLEKMIGFVNKGIALIEQIPGSTWHIYIDLPQMFLLYGFLIAILVLIHTRNFRYMVQAFGCVFLFVGLNFHRFYHQNQQRSITFYHVNKESHVDFTQGLTNFHLGDFNKKAKHHITPNHIQAGVLTTWIESNAIPKENDRIALQKINNLLVGVWHGKRVIFIQEPFEKRKDFSEKVQVDILVVSNNAVKKLEPLQSIFDFSLLVIDSSNQTHWAKKLAKEADASNISYHAVPQQGSLTISIIDK